MRTITSLLFFSLIIVGATSAYAEMSTPTEGQGVSVLPPGSELAAGCAPCYPPCRCIGNYCSCRSVATCSAETKSSGGNPPFSLKLECNLMPQRQLMRPGAFESQGFVPQLGMVVEPTISVDDVRAHVEMVLTGQGFDRLKVGKVEEKHDDTITVEIVTADGSLVQRLNVDRRTGSISRQE